MRNMAAVSGCVGKKITYDQMYRKKVKNMTHLIKSEEHDTCDRMYREKNKEHDCGVRMCRKKYKEEHDCSVRMCREKKGET